MSFAGILPPKKQKTHRQHLRVGLGLASRIVETYSTPVGQHTRARPQKQQQQQARMGEPIRVIAFIRLGGGGKGVNKAPLPTDTCCEFDIGGALVTPSSNEVTRHSPVSVLPALRDHSFLCRKLMLKLCAK
jgi:hypothetical protein